MYEESPQRLCENSPQRLCENSPQRSCEKSPQRSCEKSLQPSCEKNPQRSYEKNHQRRRFIKSAMATALGAGAAGAGMGPLPRAAAAVPVDTSTKITGINTFVMRRAIFVKVTADNGMVGWGECAQNNKALMETFVHNGLKQQVIGRDPFDTEPLWDQMFYLNHDLGPGGALANAIAGIDIAIWDLKARMLGLPVYKLLGGKYRDRVLAYGSFAVDAGNKMTPKQAAAEAVDFVRDGFTVVKLRMQIREYRLNPEPDPTLVYVRAVDRAIGNDAEIFVDINNGYSAGRAVQVGRQLFEEFGIRYYEEPCSDQNHRETRQVVDELQDMLVIAGEKEYTRWQLTELITRANPDIINPDIVKAGGITEMKKIAAIAQAFTKPIVCHNTRPTLATAATLHFAASISNCGPFVEFPETKKKFAALLRVMDTNVRLEDGFLYLPEGPGLGIEVNEQRVRAASQSIK